MNAMSFPSIEKLVPHSDAMLLLDRILEHDTEQTVCGAVADFNVHFMDSGGQVPSWVGLEYMAQCAAVHGGLSDHGRNQTPRPGLLLGTRRLRLHTDVLPNGEELRVTARHHMGTSGLVAFDCSIHSAADGEILAEGRLNIYILEDWSELGEMKA